MRSSISSFSASPRCSWAASSSRAPPCPSGPNGFSSPVLALGSLVFFRNRVYGAMHPPADGPVQEGVTGDVAVAQEAIAPNATGVVDLRGARWNAHNAGPTVIEAGARCTVSRSEGLTLHVEAEQ